MADTDMDFADGANIVKELWSRLLYSQYHEKELGAELIHFQKLVCLQYSGCKRTSNYVGNLHELSQNLANIGRVCENLWSVYLLFSGLEDEHASWATVFRNASRKEVDQLSFNVVTLDKFCLINKPEYSESNMALFKTNSQKRRFNSTFTAQSNRAKSTSNEANAQCTYCKKPSWSSWLLATGFPQQQTPG